MKSNKTLVTDTPLFLVVDDRKIQLNTANVSIERRITGAIIQISGTADDMGQINDLSNYLVSIPIEPAFDPNNVA